LSEPQPQDLRYACQDLRYLGPVDGLGPEPELEPALALALALAIDE
jgi:hypothetical protein